MGLRFSNLSVPYLRNIWEFSDGFQRTQNSSSMMPREAIPWDSCGIISLRQSMQKFA